MWITLNKSDASDVRPEGPAFNSHAREGVDQELPKGERRRCGTKIDAGMKCRPVGPRNLSKQPPRPHGRGYWIPALRAFVVRELVLTLTASSPSLSMTTRQTRMSSRCRADLWIRFFRARMSMVDGLPYKEEVGGSSPSAPTKSDVRF